MRYLLCFLMLFPVTCLAEPFNIYLPFNTQYTPGSLQQFKKAVVIGVENGGNNFQIQLAPITDVDEFIDNGSSTDAILGFKIGLGQGFEFETDLNRNGASTSFKYSFEQTGVALKHAFILGDITAKDSGHRGALLGPEDCGFFDISCTLSGIFSLFGYSNDRYEYNYRADIRGLMFAYLQGYQYSQNLMPYWGVYFIDYDVTYNVVDNTGGGANELGRLSTDLNLITVGAKWDFSKPGKDGRSSSLLLNYVLFKDSDSHRGELNGELRLSYIRRF